MAPTEFAMLSVDDESRVGPVVDRSPDLPLAGATPALRREPSATPNWGLHSLVLPEPANDDDFARLEQRYRALEEALVETATGRVEALRRLTGLRRTNEELQNCFSALERNCPPDGNALSLSYADEPANPELRAHLGWSSNGLAQVLPVSSTGVSAFEIHLASMRASPGAILHVHLIALENHRVVDRWTVPMDEITPGWTMFGLTRQMLGSTRTLELRLDVECDADVNIGLSLGREQAIGAFQARNPVTSELAAPHGLALRVWCGDTNAANARRSNIVVADSLPSPARGLQDLPLSPTLLGAVRHLGAEEASFTFEPVTWVPYRVAVACHPPSAGITIAALPLTVDGRIRAVLADVEVGHAKSMPVEFAAVLSDDPQRAEQLFEQTILPEPHEAFSGWVTADPEQSARIVAELARPSSRALTLFLATRMKVPGNKDYAWARFRRLTVRTAL